MPTRKILLYDLRIRIRIFMLDPDPEFIKNLGPDPLNSAFYCVSMIAPKCEEHLCLTRIVTKKCRQSLTHSWNILIIYNALFEYYRKVILINTFKHEFTTWWSVLIFKETFITVCWKVRSDLLLKTKCRKSAHFIHASWAKYVLCTVNVISAIKIDIP